MGLKNYIYLAITTLFFIGCNSKNENSFRLSGKIHNLEKKEIILSKIENFQKKQQIVIDTLRVNTLGEFNVVYFLEPGIYSLNINSEKKLQLAINYGQHIDISGSSIENLEVTGSTDTNLLGEYENYRIESLNRLVKSVRTEIKNLKKENAVENEEVILKLREKEVDNYKIHLQELTDFVNTKMKNSIALYATSTRWNSENIDVYKALVSNFEIEYPTISITKKLKEKINLLEKTSIGSILNNIKLSNTNGDIVSLDSTKLKYTLVDFWASWCPPCRAESKLLNELYLKHYKAGFEIYGISLDTSEKRWLNALKTDNRDWPNVSSLEGFQTKAAQNLGITALPTNFLIDSTGKIIAVNIHGEELKNKIEELFKYAKD